LLPNLNRTDALFQIRKTLAERSLAEFVKQAWHVIEPGQKYLHGWHVDAIAEHLEAVTSGDIMRLLVNVPPGTMKSLLVGVFWPAWEWGPKDLAHLRYVSASHEQTLAIRDTMKMRRLIASDWYQERWPLKLMSDQNAKIKFENEKTGFRQACAVTSMTGNRGDRVLWDDPHSVEGSLSDADRETTIRVLHETLPTRLNNPDSSAIIIVMQRLHERDVSGVLLEEKQGYVHLMLPMEFELDRRCTTSIGFSDPRTKQDELLFPDRFPRFVVDRDKKAMGSMAAAGQFQQRPTPRGGGSIKADFLVVGSPQEIIKKIRYWDKAGTEGAGCFTAGVLMGVDKNGRYWILDVIKGQWAAPARERVIRQTAEIDGPDVVVWIEQEPGSGGKESAESTITNLAGFVCRADRVTGDKESRAEPLAVQIEAGNVGMVAGPWNADFVAEARTFPVGKYKDQIDAAAGAFVKISGKNGVSVFGNQFSELQHIARTGLWPLPKRDIFIGWHLGVTPACVFVQVIDGQVRVLEEVVATGHGARAFAVDVVAKKIRTKYAKRKFISVGDRNLASKMLSDERSCAEILDEELGPYGIITEPAYVDDMTGRLEAVRRFLEGKTNNGAPAMQIDPDCKLLLKGFDGGYFYKITGDDQKLSSSPQENECSLPHNALQFVLAEIAYLQSQSR
jgi:predicted phage terminase large subunit-like protein